MISARPVIAARGKASAEGFRGDDDVGLDAIVLTGKHSAGAAEAGLHFIGDEEDVVFAAEVDENFDSNRAAGR